MLPTSPWKALFGLGTTSYMVPARWLARCMRKQFLKIIFILINRPNHHLLTCLYNNNKEPNSKSSVLLSLYIHRYRLLEDLMLKVTLFFGLLICFFFLKKKILWKRSCTQWPIKIRITITITQVIQGHNSTSHVLYRIPRNYWFEGIHWEG